MNPALGNLCGSLHAGHDRPNDGLGVGEDPGLDGFVFSGCGHGYAVASRMDVISGDSL
jgi:hypothetical protein